MIGEILFFFIAIAFMFRCCFNIDLKWPGYLKGLVFVLGVPLLAAFWTVIYKLAMVCPP